MHRSLGFGFYILCINWPILMVLTCRKHAEVGRCFDRVLIDNTRHDQMMTCEQFRDYESCFRQYRGCDEQITASLAAKHFYLKFHKLLPGSVFRSLRVNMRERCRTERQALARQAQCSSTAKAKRAAYEDCKKQLPEMDQNRDFSLKMELDAQLRQVKYRLRSRHRGCVVARNTLLRWLGFRAQRCSKENVYCVCEATRDTAAGVCPFDCHEIIHGPRYHYDNSSTATSTSVWVIALFFTVLNNR